MRAWALLLLSVPLAAQTPSFEVASVRPGNRTNTGSLCSNLKMSLESTLLSAVWPLNALIHEAYLNEVDDFDFPQGLNSTNYAVNVKVPPNTSVDTCRHMLRNLLAERFRLAIGVETQEVFRYYVKVAKSGLKLKPVSDPPADPTDSHRFDVKDSVVRFTFRGAPMSVVFNTVRTAAELDARAHRLFEGAFRLAAVVDETGLTGYYDGQFEFESLGFMHREFAESLQDGLIRQLGLTLELRRAPGRVLVIQSVDRTPAEN